MTIYLYYTTYLYLQCQFKFHLLRLKLFVKHAFRSSAWTWNSQKEPAVVVGASPKWTGLARVAWSWSGVISWWSDSRSETSSPIIRTRRESGDAWRPRQTSGTMWELRLFYREVKLEISIKNISKYMLQSIGTVHTNMYIQFKKKQH